MIFEQNAKLFCSQKQILHISTEELPKKGWMPKSYWRNNDHNVEFRKQWHVFMPNSWSHHIFSLNNQMIPLMNLQSGAHVLRGCWVMMGENQFMLLDHWAPSRYKRVKERPAFLSLIDIRSSPDSCVAVYTPPHHCFLHFPPSFASASQPAQHKTMSKSTLRPNPNTSLKSLFNKELVAE